MPGHIQHVHRALRSVVGQQPVRLRHDKARLGRRRGQRPGSSVRSRSRRGRRWPRASAADSSGRRSASRVRITPCAVVHVLREQHVQRWTAELDAAGQRQGKGVRHRGKRSGADAGGGQLSVHERLDRCRRIPNVDCGDRGDHRPDGAGGADRDVGVAAGRRKGTRPVLCVDVEEGDGPAGLAEELAEEPAADAACAEDHGPSHGVLPRGPPWSADSISCRRLDRPPDSRMGWSWAYAQFWAPHPGSRRLPLPDAHWYQTETQSEHMLAPAHPLVARIGSRPSLRSEGDLPLARGGARRGWE